MQNDWRDLIKPKTVEFDEKEVTPSYGKFSAEPLERGYGITVGNALRRILLSTLPGYAITAVRIKNVLHEFSTLAGVKEDVTDIVLNLKEIRLRLHEGEQITATLKVKGEAQVTARDITGGPSLEILTPDKHIASLDKGADLDMELVIKRGRGYVPGERTEDEEAIGTIRLDAIFSPIRKVNFTVTNARVGQRTDYDKLILEVWTDGRITPDDALLQASAILRHHLDVFVNYDDGQIEFDEKPEELNQENTRLKKLLNMSVNEIELSVRAANCLNSANLTTVGQLAMKSEAEMLKYRNFGKKSLNEIKDRLLQLGLSLGMKFESGLVEPPMGSERSEDGKLVSF